MISPMALGVVEDIDDWVYFSPGQTVGYRWNGVTWIPDTDLDITRFSNRRIGGQASYIRSDGAGGTWYYIDLVTTMRAFARPIAGSQWHEMSLDGATIPSLASYRCGDSTCYVKIPRRWKAQWDPRWARIDFEDGFTEFAFEDENGNAVTPAVASQQVFCEGDRKDGFVYYVSNRTLYRRRIENYVSHRTVERLWTRADDTLTPSHIAFNEESGAIIFNSSNSWTNDVIIASSVESAATANAISAGLASNRTRTWNWINNAVLLASRPHNGTTWEKSSISGIGTTTYRQNIWFGDSEKIFIERSHGDNRLPFYTHEYDWNTNTISPVLFERWLGQITDQPTDNRSRCVADTLRKSFLFPTTTASTPVRRTVDGVNFNMTDPTGTNPGAQWEPRMFPHIGILHARSTGDGTWWRQHDDVIGRCNVANSLFDGYLASHFYAGKKMLVNGNRLYSVVHK